MKKNRENFLALRATQHEKGMKIIAFFVHFCSVSAVFSHVRAGLRFGIRMPSCTRLDLGPDLGPDLAGEISIMEPIDAIQHARAIYNASRA